jgi:light-regulated signal transduction histidine kinase (bacteriophytochrome)
LNASKSAIPQWQIDASRFAILNRLAADLVHGIKNPLNSMVINLHVLESKAAKGETDAVRERATVLEHEIRRLNALIEVLSGLLRPEKDRTVPTSVSRVVEEVGIVLALRTRDARLEFTMDNLAVDAFTPVPAYTLRFGLLAAAELIFDLAQHAGAAMWLTAEQQSAEISIRIGFAGEPDSLRAAEAQPADYSGSLRGMPAAAALLEPAGATIHIEMGQPAILIRLPHSV